MITNLGRSLTTKLKTSSLTAGSFKSCPYCRSIGCRTCQPLLENCMLTSAAPPKISRTSTRRSPKTNLENSLPTAKTQLVNKTTEVNRAVQLPARRFKVPFFKCFRFCCPVRTFSRITCPGSGLACHSQDVGSFTFVPEGSSPPSWSPDLPSEELSLHEGGHCHPFPPMCPPRWT